MPKERYDAGHYSFLETVRVLHEGSGAGFATDSLMASGVGAAGKVESVVFTSIEAFYASMESGDNPITDFEGRAVHYGDGVFGLTKCPFSAPLSSYMAEHGYARSFRDVTEEMNKGSALTRRLRVGEGSAVSPFCVMHQPIRSAMGERFNVDGRPVLAYQLGCRSWSGQINVAQRWLEVTGVAPELVTQVLREHVLLLFSTRRSGHSDLDLLGRRSRQTFRVVRSLVFVQTPRAPQRLEYTKSIIAAMPNYGPARRAMRADSGGGPREKPRFFAGGGLGQTP